MSFSIERFDSFLWTHPLGLFLATQKNALTKRKQVQLVTNVFCKTKEGWKMTRHHSSDRDMLTQKASSGGGPSVSSLLGGGKPSPGGIDGDHAWLSQLIEENSSNQELGARVFRVTEGGLRYVFGGWEYMENRSVY